MPKLPNLPFVIKTIMDILTKFKTIALKIFVSIVTVVTMCNEYLFNNGSIH